MAKKKVEYEEDVLCVGVNLSDTFYEKKENRLFTILLKGFVVYLISMGSIGFYLSAFDEIEYNELFCHIVIFITAMLCALLYYRLLVENIGYMILLAVFALMVYRYRDIINSGFYAIVNITVEYASNYFGQTVQRLYTERIENRYLTITFMVLFIGIVLNILLNVYISRRMQYFTAIFIVMGLNMIPLYIVEEPNNFYVIMFLAGISMAYVFKSGQHYSEQVSTKRNDYIYEKRKKSKKTTKKKTELSYKSDVKAMLQAGAIAMVFVIICVNVITAFKPKATFNAGYKTNKYKELSMVGVSTVLLEGISGLFRRNGGDVGGLMGGRLGDVASVRPDNETDLLVQFTPYSYDNVYLKGASYTTYHPYDNRWSMENNVYSSESEALRESYDNGEEYSSKGIMIITQKDNWRHAFYPYYFDNVIEKDGETYTVEYYPRLTGNPAVVDDSLNNEFDLAIPEENIDAISDFVSLLGVDENNTLNEKVSAIREYYQENIPYTIKPGKTPKKADFINHFLEVNKRGYCSHFASAATLALRYLGVPARYVEGYAVDYYQMMRAELVEGAEYGEYYDGYSELGETALLEVDVTDADAHAWIEVYDETQGWIVADVTPSATLDEDNESFWEAFENFTNDNPDSLLAGGGAAGLMNIKIPDSVIKRICYVLLGILLAMLLAFLLKKLILALVYMSKYKKAGINDRLIMKYSSVCRRMRRRDKAFAGMCNYREQVGYFGGECDNIITILEKAGFSKKLISEEEYHQVLAWLDRISSIKKHEEQ